MAKIAVIYYSATGNAHAVAHALGEGAETAGAEVRIRKVRELAPDEAIATNPKWVAHREATGHIEEATLAYLRLTGRSEEHIALTEAYFREQGMFHTPDAAEAEVIADPPSP